MNYLLIATFIVLAGISIYTFWTLRNIRHTENKMKELIQITKK
ncbi:hypothetical protein P9274_22540 [Schinkia azotoformans]|nr:hypothetical protein [Schinkia azotoformans]